MKTLVCVLVCMFAVSAFAIEMADYNQVTLTKSSDPAPYCPKTKISDNDKCMSCHVLKMSEGKPVFGLKEIDESAGYDLPYGTSMRGFSLHWVNTGTGSNAIKNISHYMYKHPEFKKFIMEIDSPGGSVMDAWRAIGIIEEMRVRGIEIETKCYGMAASAGTLLFISGNKGNRFVNPHAEIMLHKLWTFAMFKLDDPDTAEDQAELLKHLQQNINEYIKDRTGLTHEKLDEQMFKKDWWITGAEAVGLGIADGFIE